MNESYVRYFEEKILNSGLGVMPNGACMQAEINKTQAFQPYSLLREVPIVQSNGSQPPVLASNCLIK